MTPDHAAKERALASSYHAGPTQAGADAPVKPGFLESLNGLQRESEAAIERIKGVMARIGQKAFGNDQKDNEVGCKLGYASHIDGALSHARQIRNELLNIEEALTQFSREI